MIFTLKKRDRETEKEEKIVTSIYMTYKTKRQKIK